MNWKKLNEARTPGPWYTDENSFIVRRHAGHEILEALSVPGKVDNSKRVINAQFTALAVNNFAEIAELLIRAGKRLQQMKFTGEWKPADNILLNKIESAIAEIS